MLHRFMMFFLLAIFCTHIAAQKSIVKRQTKVYAVKDNVLNGNYRIYNAPLISTECHRWGITGIALSRQSVVLRKWCIPKEARTYVWSSPNEFIEDAQTKRRFYIVKSDIGIGEDNMLYLDNSEQFMFGEWYPPLPSSVKVINIFNGSRYIIRNLQLNR